MIDAGPREEWNEFDAGRDVIAPYLRREKITRIDYAVLTHPHLDHLGVEDGTIMHGANDDASGTVAVLELARTLAGIDGLRDRIREIVR